MGHGPARELAVADDVTRTLGKEHKARLDVAVERIDDFNEHFAQARHDEKVSQQSKAWSAMCSEMEGQLRMLARVFLRSHQLSFDMGIDGGGLSARVFMEETGRTFERVYFEFDEGELLARYEGNTLDTIPLEDFSVDWLERMVVEWVVAAAEDLR